MFDLDQSRERALKCLVLFRKVDRMLNLSEHLKKMVDDERGPCGGDEVNRELMGVRDDAGDPRSQSLALRA
jgi:hypothetical protein